MEILWEGVGFEMARAGWAWWKGKGRLSGLNSLHTVPQIAVEEEDSRDRAVFVEHAVGSKLAPGNQPLDLRTLPLWRRRGGVEVLVLKDEALGGERTRSPTANL